MANAVSAVVREAKWKRSAAPPQRPHASAASRLAFVLGRALGDEHSGAEQPLGHPW